MSWSDAGKWLVRGVFTLPMVGTPGLRAAAKSRSVRKGNIMADEAEGNVRNLRASKKERAAKSTPRKPRAKKAEPKGDSAPSESRRRWEHSDSRHSTTLDNGDVVAMVKKGDKWDVTVTTPEGVATMVAEQLGKTTAYQRCVEHCRGQLKIVATT